MTAVEQAPETLAGALAKLQSALPEVKKGETAKVPTKAGGSYSYTYANLADVSRAILPLLGGVGLSFSAKPTMTGDRFALVYMLRHSSGEIDEGIYPLPDPARSTPQEIGSAITYARRYTLCSITGLSPDGDDDDAAAASQQRPGNGNGNGRQQRQQPTADGPKSKEQLRGEIAKAGTAKSLTIEEVADEFASWSQGVHIRSGDVEQLTKFLAHLTTPAPS